MMGSILLSVRVLRGVRHEDSIYDGVAVTKFLVSLSGVDIFTTVLVVALLLVVVTLCNGGITLVVIVF